MMYQQNMLGSKHIVVTGCNGLIGSYLANQFHRLGANLTLIDLSINLSPVLDLPSEAYNYYSTNVTDYVSLLAAITDSTHSFGPVDSLFTLAAINPKVTSLSTTDILNPSTSYDHFSVSVEGSRNAALACFENRSNALSVVFFGSDLSVISPYHPLYSDTLGPSYLKPFEYSVVKHSLVGLCKYYATLWAPFNVRCNLLCPSGIENPGMPENFKTKLASLNPTQRLLNISELLGPAIFLGCDMSSFVNAHTLIVDGGRTAW